jgi:excisionase family DNA binding protein
MTAEDYDALQVLATNLLGELVQALRPGSPTPPSLLTLEQAAERLAVSRTTVQELVDSGVLPVVSVTGRAVRVDPRDVEAYIRAKRTRR